MNTVMNKYKKMHINFLEVCETHGIKVMPGKKISYEIFHQVLNESLKDYLILPEDVERFFKCCWQDLEEKGYSLEKGKNKTGIIYNLYCKDVLATTVNSLMTSTDSKHCPRIIIRQLVAENDVYKFFTDGKVVTFSAQSIDNLEKISYLGKDVYAKSDIKKYVSDIYGINLEEERGMLGYALYNDMCIPQEFIKEAKKRGFLSKKRIERYNEYKTWKKENRSENEKKYKEYQKVLLGLKLP